MNVGEKIKQLRTLMRPRNIDAYVIPTSDPHQSEYLSDHFKTREFISGFTGSAGTVVVTMEEAVLWTDGRYFIQAEKELKGSEIKLYPMGEPDVPDLISYLNAVVPEYGKIGFDGRCISLSTYKRMSKELKTRLLISDVDYVGKIWTDRPALPDDSIYIHDIKYAGESAREKIAKLRNRMEDKNVDYTFIGSLEDICYLYNIRGNDINFNPVVIAFAFISFDQAYLCIDQRKITDDVKEHLLKNGITLWDYDGVYDLLKGIKGKNSIYIDPDKTNVTLYKAINSNVNVIYGINFTSYMKAIKNDVEIENQKKAYLKDATALIRFFNWVETGASTGNLTEYIASDKLLEFRKEQEGFVELSFGTIAAYKENASMPHYAPDAMNSKKIYNKNLFLVDSGGHYQEGTTDITRTIALGPITDEEKYHYTMVLKAHISLMTAKFMKGTTGSYLDAFAKQILWRNALNYNHGTGHGVGNLLSVHEGPFNLSRKDNDVPIVPGMIHSVEPGIYIEGSHGIRIENIVCVIESENNAFGTFYALEPISYVPIDTRPVDKSLLNPEELHWLNDYNKTCYEKLMPFLQDSDSEYLKAQTQEI